MAGLTASHFYKGGNMKEEWVDIDGYRIFHNTLEHLEVNS